MRRWRGDTRRWLDREMPAEGQGRASNQGGSEGPCCPKYHVQQSPRHCTAKAKKSPGPADLARLLSAVPFFYYLHFLHLPGTAANQTPSRPSSDQVQRRETEAWHWKATNDGSYRGMVLHLRLQSFRVHQTQILT